LYGTIIAFMYGAMERKTTKTKSSINDGKIRMKRKLEMTGKTNGTAICLVAVLFTCLWATASFANFSQAFSENGIYEGTQTSITKIEIFDLSTSNRDFASPVPAGNFSAGSWTVQLPNTDMVLATNATPGGTNSFNWTLYFTGQANGAVVNVAYLAYTSTGKVYGTNINLNGGSWTYPTISDMPLTLSQINNPSYNRTGAPVPIPPTVFLFGGGLVSLVALRKKTIA
jgi:hypothetical protein